MRIKVTTFFLWFLTLVFLNGSLFAQEKEHVVFYPQWTPQSQFAGFYVALDNGYFSEEGLDVEIRHIGVNATENIVDKLVSGEAQIIEQQLMQSIITRGQGTPIVNVMQITQNCALCCVAQHTLDSPNDLNGMKISRWKIGYAELTDIIVDQLNLDVEWIPSLGSNNLFIYGAVDATLCYSYSELIRLILAKGDIPEENTLRFADYGFNYPEDGLYVTEDYYTTHRETVEKFIRATQRGWDFAREHFDEALAISKRYTKENNIVTNNQLERMMLEEYLQLQINPTSHKADYSPVSPALYDEITRQLSLHGYLNEITPYNTFIR